jgi:hypothetical protein
VVQVVVVPAALPLPWKPNSVYCPAGMVAFRGTLVNWTVPVLPLGPAFQVLATVAPEGSAAVTRPPLAQLARRPSAPARSSRAMYQEPSPGFCSLDDPYSLIW